MDLHVIREESEFQAEGPATENALLASFVLVLDWAKATRRWVQAVGHGYKYYTSLLSK